MNTKIFPKKSLSALDIKMISRVFRSGAVRSMVSSRIRQQGAVLGSQQERFAAIQKASFSAQTTGIWKGNPSLDVDKALNIVETINMYLESSNAQVRLKEINEQKKNTKMKINR